MKNGMRVIDLEHHFDLHWVLGEWKKTFSEQEWINGGGCLYDNPPEEFKGIVELICDLGEIRLKAMDDAGIDFAQISLTHPGPEYFDVNLGKKIATEYNNAMMEAIKRHPDRFGAYMCLVPEDVEWSLKEIDRCTEGGMFGWATLSNFRGKYLDNPKYFPILKKLANLNMPIYLHPNYTNWNEFKEYGYCLNGPSLGFTIDTLLSYMRIIHSGVFDKLPNLKVILGHDGEGFPFFKNRVDTAWRQGHGQPAKNLRLSFKNPPSYYLDKNTWCTTSGNYSQIALRCTIDSLGIDKVMVATDLPYENVKEMIDFIGDNKELNKEQKEAILHGNAEALGFGKNYLKR